MLLSCMIKFVGSNLLLPVLADYFIMDKTLHA